MPTDEVLLSNALKTTGTSKAGGHNEKQGDEATESDLDESDMDESDMDESDMDESDVVL